MIDSLHQFQDRVEQLISFLEDAEAINALVDANTLEAERGSETSTILSNLARLRSSKIDRKVQTYVTSVVLLYGLFEQYVEEVLMAYLEELDSIIKRFDDVPEKIKRSHTNLSAQLLINRDLDKYRDRCNEADIISRMQSCTTGGPFHLNALAFIDHKSNFRIDPLNQFFEPAGISGMSTLIRQAAAFEEYRAKRFPEQEISNIPDKVVFDELDDLAWRRNVVAHGWPEDTLSIAMMKERAEFIRVLGECIYEVLHQSVLPHIIRHRGQALPKPLVVYNNCIVCFHIEAGSISSGSRIIACNSGGRYLEGRIRTLEIDHVPHTHATAPPAVDVACLVDFKAKDTYLYYLVEDPRGE